MMPLRKILVFASLLLFLCPAALPQTDGDVIELSDNDATIQNNPNYTEPEKINKEIGEAVVEETTVKEKETVMSDKEKQQQGEEDLVVESHASTDKVEDNDELLIVTDDESDDDDSDFDSDNEYDEEDEYDDDAVPVRVKKSMSQDKAKVALAQALSKSRKVPRSTVKFVKKHRVKITIAAVLFAFRKEIRRIAVHILTKPKTIDPETGKVLSRTIHLSPTSVVKIILFLDLMRKLNSGEVTEPGPLGSKGSFIFKLLHQSNNAFVPPIEQHWTFEKVNERYEKDGMAFQKAMGAPGSALGMGKKPMAESLRSFAASSILGNAKEKKQDLVILLDWTKLTESIDQMSSLRDQVSFLLSQHRAKKGITSVSTNATNANITETTEIIVLLESPGGAAADYGLAAQMMLRLCHEPGLVVTVCVDKVAASGGYMIACASSPGRLYAAPFSVLGSIGVVGTAINVNDVLRGWGVRPLVFRGGKNKAPVGLVGEVTKDGIKQVQNMVDATHVAFKRHVVAARPILSKNIDKIATGKVWLGYEALNVGLVDRIITSDEYIGERLLEGARVLRLVKYNKPRFLFPPHPSRTSLVSAPLNVVRESVRTMMTEFSRVVEKLSGVDDIPLVSADSRLTAATTSLGASIQKHSAASGKVS